MNPGSGARSTVIEAPAVLDTNVLGLTYIAQINGGATVNMKGFTVDASTSCDVFLGVTVFGSATLNLDTSVITGCYQVGLIVGSTLTPGGPQTGHATITRTNVNGYQNQGIIAHGPPGTTLTVSYSTITAVEGSPIDGQAGITDDAGIGVFGNSECCKIDHNVLTDNRFFGIIVGEGEHTISNTKISGGNIGMLAVAFSVDTVATLNRVIIVGTTTPTQELSVGATAEVVFVPRSVQTAQTTISSTGNPFSFVLPTPAFADLSS